MCERSLESPDRVLSYDLDRVRVEERLLDILERLLDLLDPLEEYNFSNLASLFACRSAIISNLDDNLDVNEPIDACRLDESTWDIWSKKVVFPDVCSILSDGAT